MPLSPYAKSLIRSVLRPLPFTLIPFYRESSQRAVLRVTRFGAGYWIGGVCASLIGVIQALSSALLFRTGLAGALVAVVMFGASFSAGGFVEGWRAQDRDRVVGGFLGFVLCGWLSVVLFTAFLHYYDSFFG